MMSSSSRPIAGLISPAFCFLLICFIVPVLLLLSTSLQGRAGWSLENFGTFFQSTLNRRVLWTTIKLGVLVTLSSVVLGYIAALSIVDLSAGNRGRVLGLTMLPLMISPVARTYAWLVLLGQAGVLNDLLQLLGFTEQPIRFLFTETAVYLGLLQLFLPLMILSLVSALENLPQDVVTAARTLGAGWLTVFFKVILPLTREGLIIGGTLVFTGSITAYITPAVLGGSRVLMLETLLYQRVHLGNDIKTASVIAVILVALSFVANYVIRKLSSRKA
jgi:putative spermidine/putrescine transport system permease protein